MDLEEWRKSNGLLYRDLASLIGATEPGHARRYALGESWPRADRLEVILKQCPGVDLFAMHQRRLAWVRAHERVVPGLTVRGSDVDSVSSGSDGPPLAQAG